MRVGRGFAATNPCSAVTAGSVRRFAGHGWVAAARTGRRPPLRDIGFARAAATGAVLAVADRLAEHLARHVSRGTSTAAGPSSIGVITRLHPRFLHGEHAMVTPGRTGIREIDHMMDESDNMRARVNAMVAVFRAESVVTTHHGVMATDRARLAGWLGKFETRARRRPSGRDRASSAAVRPNP